MAFEYGIIDTDQYCDLFTSGSSQEIDDFRRELRALFDAQLLIRLHSDIFQPLLYKLSPLGGKVLYEAGRITEKQIPKRTRLDASDVYWEHRLMRGNLRVAITKLFRENALSIPEWKGSVPFTVNKTPPQKVFPDDFFVIPIRPKESGFTRALAVETHNWGKAKKAAEKMASTMPLFDMVA